MNQAIGSPIAATNWNSVIQWKEHYAPYGQRQVVSPFASSNRQWFHGKPQDETGLQYFGARYYDPLIGRFMGIEPVGFKEDNLHSFNRYAYGNNNPVKYIDPDGNSPIDIGFLIYDVANLVQSIYKGEDTNSALIDVGISVAGVLAPIPGAGQALKAARTAEHVAEGARAAEKLVKINLETAPLNL